MAFNFGGFLSGIGGLAQGIGAGVSAFRDPPMTTGEAAIEAARLRAPFTGIISTPSLRFGGGALARRGPDTFGLGQRRLQRQLAQLRGEVRPGFGRLTQSGVNAIRQRAARATGDLRANLAKRGLAGASFAEDLLGRVEQEFGQAESEFRSQAFQAELQAMSELIDREQTSLAALATRELEELGLATNFLQSVNQVAVNQAALAKAIGQENLLRNGPPRPAGPQPGRIAPQGGAAQFAALLARRNRRLAAPSAGAPAGLLGAPPANRLGGFGRRGSRR